MIDGQYELEILVYLSKLSQQHFGQTWQFLSLNVKIHQYFMQ